MDMEKVYETRRARLLQATYEQFEKRGAKKKLAELLGCHQNYISRILSHPDAAWHKSIGEGLARQAEEQLGKPMYWLDGNESSNQWPFEHIDPDDLMDLGGVQIGRIESVVQTMIDAMHQQDENEDQNV